MDNRVTDYINALYTWKEEIETIRGIIIRVGLVEDFKWNHPCYTSKNKNIAVIQEFKDYCAIMFLKGYLLEDPQKKLVKVTENVYADRQLRFTTVSEIREMEDYINILLLNAVQIEQSGIKQKRKETNDYVYPQELIDMIESDEEFKIAFNNLTPGRQKGYLIHFSEPKQSITKVKRIQKNIIRIKKGAGLTDCICGRSQRMPYCDGSHKGNE